MTRYREILRLSSLGFSNRNIALSVPCSRNTVAKVLKRAQELDISWPLEDNQTDEVIWSEKMTIQEWHNEVILNIERFIKEVQKNNSILLDSNLMQKLIKIKETLV